MSHLQRRTKSGGRKLRLESLESRRLLAADGLVSHWPLDTSSSFVLRDAGPAQNHLLSGFNVRFTDSERGRAVDNLQHSEIIAVDGNPNLSAINNAVTVSGWMNASNLETGGAVFAISQGLSLRPLGDALEFKVTTTDNGNSHDNLLLAEFGFQHETWYHIAGTFDGDQMIAYVNGVEVGRSAVVGTLNLNGNIGIGVPDIPGLPFRGKVDDVMLFSRSLNAAEIEQLFHSGATLNTSNGASYFHEQANPVAIDPNMVIESDLDHFDNGLLTVSLHPAGDGDFVFIHQNENISVSAGDVFFTSNSTTSKIGTLGASSDLTVSVSFNENATPEAVQTLARSISFTTTSTDSHDREVTVRLSTRSGAQPFFDERVIVFWQPNQSPLTIETSPGATQYVPREVPVPVDPLIRLESDRPDFGDGTLTVSFVEGSGGSSDGLLIAGDRILQSGNEILYHDVSYRVIGSFEGGRGGDPLVIRLNERATQAATLALARAIKYRVIVENPPLHSRFIQFTLNDGDREASDVKRIDVQEPSADELVLSADDKSTFFEPGELPVMILESGVRLAFTDPKFDGGSAQVTFAEESARPGDRLSVVGVPGYEVVGNQVVRRDVVVADFEVAADGQSIHFNVNENADFSSLNGILILARFGNNSSEVEEGTRLVRFRVSEADSGSAELIQRVVVGVENGPLLIETSSGAALYSQGSEPVIIDPRVKVAGTDSAIFAGGTLTASFVEESHEPGDELLLRESLNIFVDDNNHVHRVSEGTSTKIGILLLGNGSLRVVLDEAAGVDEVRMMARLIAFRSSSGEIVTGNRFIRFAVNDGNGGEVSSVRRVEVVGPVNDDPTVSVNDQATIFEVAHDPVIIAAGIEVGDTDSPDFDGGSIVVSFVENSGRASDSLNVVAGEGIHVDGNHVFLVQEGESILLGAIRSPGGGGEPLTIDLLASVTPLLAQRIVRQIAFFSDQVSVEPNESRFVKFHVFDGDGGQASTVKRVDVLDSNDPPVVVVSDGSTIYDLAGHPVIVAAAIEVSDLDSENFAGGSLVVTLVENSGRATDTIGISDGNGIFLDNNEVYFIENGLVQVLGQTRDSSGEGVQLAIDLTADATPALTQRLARQVNFAAHQESVDENEVRFVQFSVSDGNGGSGSIVKKIDLINTDGDSDGVDDEQEQAAPFSGDGNQDGVQDNLQKHVASLRGKDERFVTFSSPPHTRLVNVRPMDDPDPTGAPADTQYPVGFFDFAVTGFDAQETVVVVLHLQPGTIANTYHAFGPTPTDSTPHWYPFLFDGQTGAKIFSDRIEVHYIDGARGDSDLAVNGVIADPGAPGISDRPWQNPSLVGDVNGNNEVTALDALQIINDIRRYSVRSLPLFPSGAEQFASAFLDVSGDNVVSVLDALQVINILARNSAVGGASSEAVHLIDVPSDDDDDDDAWDKAIESVVAELW